MITKLAYLHVHTFVYGASTPLHVEAMGLHSLVDLMWDSDLLAPISNGPKEVPITSTVTQPAERVPLTSRRWHT